MDFLALAEPGHQGYLLVSGKRALAVDPPLDVDMVAEYLPAWIRLVAVVETGIPSQRVAGGRLLSAELDVPLYGPGSEIKGAEPLWDGTPVAGFAPAIALAAPGRGASDIVLLAGRDLLVGDLDSAAWAPSRKAAAQIEATRSHLAKRFGDATIRGSDGVRPAGELVDAPDPATGREPLNASLIEPTNRGETDMFWVDPRFGGETRAIGFDALSERLGSPWAPNVVDLRAGGRDVEGARRVSPSRLAAELGGLAGGREVVVIDEDSGQAAAAAAFLARLGFHAAHCVGPA